MYDDFGCATAATRARPITRRTRRIIRILLYLSIPANTLSTFRGVIQLYPTLKYSQLYHWYRCDYLHIPTSPPYIYIIPT